MGIIKEIQSDLDNAALRVVSDYRSRLSAEALKLCGNPTDSEDLVMRTFDAVFRARDTFDSKKGDFYPWIVGVMHRVWAKTDRRIVDRATQPVDPLILNDLAGASNKTMEDILRNSDHDALRAAINHLEPEYRKLIGLYYFDDLSLKEIAAFLKTSPSSISRKLEVARKILMAKLSVQLGKKKPLAVLLGVLLGAGALFGAWQAGVSIVESMSNDGRAVSMKPPTTEGNQTTLTAADPDEPVMTYPTFSSTTATTEKEVNKQEESTMTTMKKTLLAAFSAVSLASTANAVDVEAVKTRVMPAGAVATQVGEDAGAFTYTLNNGTEQVVVFATVGSHTYTLPPNVDKITYLVVGGGGSGSCGVRGGGGGAGGFVCKEDVGVVVGDTLTAKVGDGGAQSGQWSEGNNGSNSTLTGTDLAEVVAYGGGGGKTSAVGGTGGSGGGGATAGRPIDPSQGYPGGAGAGGSSGAGPGGGGAGEPGADGITGSGKGGDGRSTMITGKEVYFAGGGRGGFGSAGGEGGGGGEGPGEDGTGGGGGGGSYSGWYGYKGGSGIVIIRWAIQKISSQVTVNTSGTGSGSVTGAGEYEEGATVTLVATADAGSHFAGWEGAPAGATSVENTLTFTMGTEPVTITAKFDEDLAKGVTVASEGGNHGTPSPAYGTYAEYADGTERTYTMGGEPVIPQGEGVKIYLAGWKLLTGTGELVRDSDTGLQDGESISLVKFTCGTSAAFTLVWRWETRYTLTTVANPAEGGTVTGAGDYAAGATVTLTANVTGGYKLTGWTGAEGAETTVSFMMPAAPTTVTANFETVPWGITVVSGETTEDHRDKCEPGTDYEFQSPLYYNVQEGASRKRCLGYTLTPMREGGEESEIKEAKLEGETLTATVTYAEPVKLTWKWADEYYFALTKDGEGTVTGPAEGWYASGTPFELTATPAKNYEFLCWMGPVSGTEATISGAIDQPMNVKALFSPIQQVKSDWEAIEGKPAMMRTVKSLGKTYCVVKFTDSTTFELPKKVTSIDCLVIGGGGAGGANGQANGGGGGGAGGLIYKEDVGVAGGDVFSITIGAGGTPVQWTSGGNGAPSSLTSVGGLNELAYGGGGGSAWNTYNGGTLASGGGGSGDAASNGGPYRADLNQGHAGGKGVAGATCGAGGGGAGYAGKDASDGQGGPGVRLSISGEPVWYAAGGAGGKSSYEHGLYGSAQSGWEGIASTGGGGGGGSSGSNAGNGASGVVIIRYALPSAGAMILIF